METNIRADVTEAKEHLLAMAVPKPEFILTLGSGLGSVAETIEQAIVVPSREIPGYPVSTAPGHKGQLVFGTLEGKNVMIVQGRTHVYEGYSAHEVAFPIRLGHAIGASKFIVTNAAGGINTDFTPGDLMIITDHINLALDNPLEARVLLDNSGKPQKPSAYDAEWIDQVIDISREVFVLKQGVYLWTKGPAYETKAEIIAFSRLGADAVGMSTVPEVTQAHQLGMRVLGISTITNHAAGLSPDELKHEDVLKVGQQIKATLEQLIRIILQNA